MSNTFIKEDGSFIEVDYNPSKHKLGKDNAKNVIIDLLKKYKPLGSEIEIVNQTINDEIEVSIEISTGIERKFFLGIGDTQSGGHTRPKDEHRIQLNGQLYNDLYQKRKQGCSTILLGVYFWNSFKNLGQGDDINQYVICAWNPTPTDSTSPLSKQIKAKTISEAIINGFARYYGSNFTACAFRPELLYYYLNNSRDLNDEIIQEQNEEVKQLKEIKPFTKLNYNPCTDKIIAYNRIIFGAPGTGKSYKLKEDSQPKDVPSPFERIERVTFHPDYTYGQFVGSYKPVSNDDGDIRYEYVPGPFMRTLTAALESGKNTATAKKYLLIVEEINRAKVAAVFGDMFQLLDREDSGESVYEIQASEDVKRYLAKELGGTKDNYTSIKLPNNMYIWCTMNSADQGVFPMDTAFKRRWEFEYIGIDENKGKISIGELPVKNGENNSIKWDSLRTYLNKKLLSECKVNEDKLLGPFFISGDVFKNAMKDDTAKQAFFKAFNSKVLMYLFEDAGKMHLRKLFVGTTGDLTFSNVCEQFKEKGTSIFESTSSGN